MTPDEYDAVKLGLAAGVATHEQIANDVGCSRRTVVRIATGKMRRPSLRGEYECAECGYSVVVKPCRICATRDYIRKRRILDARAADIRKEREQAKSCAGPTE